jgi:hypothetical protein
MYIKHCQSMVLFLWFINFWDAIADKIGEIGRINLSGSLATFIDADKISQQMSFKRDSDYLLNGLKETFIIKYSNIYDGG